jgi:hypothetical protein
MDLRFHIFLNRALKYSGLALPLLAIALWVVGQGHPENSSAFTQGRMWKGFLVIHALLATTIILQGFRFVWFLRQRSLGWMMLGAGAVYAAALIGFVFKMY